MRDLSAGPRVLLKRLREIMAEPLEPQELPYQIVRQLPSETSDPQYRIKSRDETHERVVAEHELRAASEAER